MLSPAETDLVRREASIPGLATVLDAEVFLARLRCCAPGIDLRTAQILFIKYKQGRSCRVSYTLDVAGEPVEAYARAYAVQERDTFLEDCARSSVPGLLGPGRLALEDCAVLLSVFPNDHRLPSLSRLMDAQPRQQLFGEVLPDRADLWPCPPRCLRYKAERRYLVRLLTANRDQAALKWYTEKGYARGKRHAEAFQSRGPLRVARPIGWSDRHRVLALEWLAGPSLVDLCAAPETDGEALTVAGAALAEVHARPADDLTYQPRTAEAANLMSLAESLGCLCPHLACRADRVARQLAAQLSSAPIMHCSVHGDFSAKQVLIGAQGAGLLDFDKAFCGDPATDLGNFIAQAERYALRGELSASQADRWRHALLEGYRQATGRPLPQRIEVYTAAGLLRRTQYPFQVREPDWPQRTEALLERAEAILNRLH